MVFIYINSRLLQVDASREKSKRKQLVLQECVLHGASWAWSLVSILAPQGPLSGTPAGPSEDSERMLLPPPRLLPREGTGPLSRPKLPIGSSASPQPCPEGCSILFGPTPGSPVPDPNRKVVPVPDETTLCPRFRLSQCPTPGVLPHRECVFKNEFLKCIS